MSEVFNHIVPPGVSLGWLDGYRAEIERQERERCIDAAFGWWCGTEMIDYLPTDVARDAIRAALQPK